MSLEKRNGKRPIAEKEQQVGLNDFDFGDVFRLSPDLIKEIKDQGLVYRFVDAKQLEAYGNVHKSGWVAYRAKASGSIDPGAHQQGSSPEGFVRRGTLILATRSAELDKRHRRMLKQRNDIYGNVQRNAAASMREMAREAGFKEDVVHEGYDDEQE